MSQGREFTPEQRENILESIRPYLQMGYSINKACILAQIDGSVIYKWCEADETLSKKIESWRNMVTAIARQNLVKSIQGDKDKGIPGDIDNSKWWLERTARDEFGKNLDLSSLGKPISDNIIKFVDFTGNDKTEPLKDNEND